MDVIYQEVLGKIFKCHQSNFALLWLSTLPFLWTGVPIIKESFVSGLVEIGPAALTKFLSVYSPYYPPMKMTWPFIWINLNPLHSKMFCAVWLKLFQRFCWRRLLNAINFFALSQIYPPGKRHEHPSGHFCCCLHSWGNFCKGAWPFIWSTLTWIPIPKDVWLKLAE